MNNQQILEELLALLEENNVSVRAEYMGGNGGGLCNVKGKKIFFVDTQASTAESAARCADAILDTIDIEEIFLKPQIRQFIDDHNDRENQEQKITDF